MKKKKKMIIMSKFLNKVQAHMTKNKAVSVYGR